MLAKLVTNSIGKLCTAEFDEPSSAYNKPHYLETINVNTRNYLREESCGGFVLVIFGFKRQKTVNCVLSFALGTI
jgi:hypothetical protein